MVHGIWVQPDVGTSRVFQVARFSVPADMPRAYVRERVFPEARKQWIADFAKRGYQLASRVYLFPKDYAHIELPDDGSIGLSAYEHDPAKRIEVDRRMAAYFLVRDVVVEALPESEKAAIRAHMSAQLKEGKRE